ncbi:MAG TPA: hypothetical protein VIK50_03760 [Gemmatimonadaceae bacterium]
MSSRKSRLFSSLTTALVVAACSETIGPGSTTPADPGSISLSIGSTSASLWPGESHAVTATIIRSGAFRGPVNLYVTGLQSGVTAGVSNMQTTGAVTTATITIVVGAAHPQEYSLVVHGTGSGVGEVTQAFTLTVPDGPELGFSISLSAAALSIVQGASTPTTTVYITWFNLRNGVGLYVTGLPAEVTASFDPAPWPVGNSTVLTLTVGVKAVPGIYNLQVNAFDAEQDGAVSVPLTLTVTAPPPPASYALILTAPTLSIAQATSSGPATTVYLLRTSFTATVTLSVENLPTGVTASLSPASPISDSVWQLWLHATGNAPTGTFTNVLVRGVASGLTDRTASLTLTIAEAPFVLTLSSPALSIVQGGSTATTTVNVVRHTITGPVTLYVDDGNYCGVMPPGVTAAFAPSSATGNSSELTLTLSAAAEPGVYELWVYAEASTGWFDGVMLTLTVTAAGMDASP